MPHYDLGHVFPDPAEARCCACAIRRGYHLPYLLALVQNHMTSQAKSREQVISQPIIPASKRTWTSAELPIIVNTMARARAVSSDQQLILKAYLKTLLRFRSDSWPSPFHAII